MDGFSACTECPLKDTEQCGGKQIIETGKNDKGYIVNDNGVTENKTNNPPPQKKKRKKKRK